jgi:hypothetical protein
MPLSVLDGGGVMLLVARFSSSPPFGLSAITAEFFYSIRRLGWSMANLCQKVSNVTRPSHTIAFSPQTLKFS